MHGQPHIRSCNVIQYYWETYLSLKASSNIDWNVRDDFQTQFTPGEAHGNSMTCFWRRCKCAVNISGEAFKLCLATTAKDIRKIFNVLGIVRLKPASHFTNRNKQNILHLFRMMVTDILFFLPDGIRQCITLILFYSWTSCSVRILKVKQNVLMLQSEHNSLYTSVRFLTFRWPCIVISSYNKTNQIQ